MAVNEYDPGDMVEITTSTAFQDAGGTPFDPDKVTFTVNEPGVASVDYVYGTDSEVTKNGTGDYSCTIEVETSGTWYYEVKGETTGSENRGADAGEFIVKRSNV